MQKCVRTLDIEEVGKTTRHGTFFQMNGNFSFGDYFKEGAIQYAWELITNSVDDGGLGFDPETIWATVYLDDDEAADAWHRIAGLPKERIQRLGKKDNYWHTGAPGPAGPCSEIYVDRGKQFGPDGGPAVDLAGDRFLEIWNLVFMQYEIDEVQSKEEFRVLGELPKKNIDTGMGLERVAYLMQGVDNMYEIDEVAPVLRRAADLAGVTYGRDHEADVRLRVVADHVRSGLMLIGDGITPGNEGRGYILRRLLRRAVRSMKLLGVEDASLPELLPVSRDAMSASYPELATDFARISAVAYAEEEAFRRTLSAGTTLFDTAVAKAKKAGTPALSGDQAFSLHDTYGFPIDVTLEMAAEQGVSVDEQGFRELMKQQRDRARADSRAKRTGSVDVLAYRRLLAEHGPTDWQAYDTLRTDSRVLAVISDLGEDDGSDVAATGEITRVVLDRTPFYAESGGQVADAGVLTWDGGRAEVLDVQRPVKGLVAHQVRVLEGELRQGAELTAEVDYDWRLNACQAHSGTHVVHAALREVLGPQALQSGSYNRPGYLRLDFAWQGALTHQQRTRHRGRRQRRRPRRPPGHGVLHDAARGAGLRRARAVRRDLRRAGPRRGDRRPLVARALRWHPRPRQRPDRHPRADRRVVGRFRLASGRGGRRARGLPLPGARARPGPAARRPAQGAAGRSRRAGQRHAGPAPRRRQGTRRAAVAAVGGRGRPAGRRREGRRRSCPGHGLAVRSGRRGSAHARPRRPGPTSGRQAGRGPARHRNPVARWLSWPR